ncbi:hypothetical protein Tco_1297153, partial [Tanacetum coccineum]
LPYYCCLQLATAKPKYAQKREGSGAQSAGCPTTAVCSLPLPNRIMPKKEKAQVLNLRANAIEGQAEVLHRLANGLIHRAVALHWQAQELNWKAKALHLRK